jgi:membrane protease YdiL (CAAX protease family)
MAQTLVNLLFGLILTAGVPALSWKSARSADICLLPRVSLYISAAFSQWILALLGVVVIHFSVFFKGDLGLRPVSPRVGCGWSLLLVVTSFGITSLIAMLQDRGWWPPEPPLVYHLIPVTRREKICSIALVTFSAALCEEFLYRGYLFHLIAHWTSGLWWGWGLSSAAFGLAHVYQGSQGMLRSAVLGCIMALPVVFTGSILPGVVAHFLVDAAAFLWLGPKLLAARQQAG